MEKSRKILENHTYCDTNERTKKRFKPSNEVRHTTKRSFKYIFLLDATCIARPHFTVLVGSRSMDFRGIQITFETNVVLPSK